MRFNLPQLNGLRVFEAVARHVSFSRAAEELNLTPSALSHQIRTLENQFGQPLFKRMNRSIALTQAGQRLLPGVEQGLLLLNEAVEQLAAPGNDSRLVVSTGPAFAAKWLVPRLHRFVDAYPEIEILVSANMKNIDFLTGDADVGIRFGLGVYDGLEAEPLLDETATPACTPELAARLASPEALAGVLLLHDDSIRHLPDVPGWADWLTEAGAMNVDPSRGLRFNHAEHALDAAAAGAGVVLARQSLAAGDIRIGRLVTPFSLRLPIHPRFHLVGLPATFRRRAAATFRDWVRQEIAETSAAS
ncbi:transcriptional regulator GcvA [Stappia sp. ES.058]|uniref:transcriptional regulator GcvA n=1 Tax=Stappia sp. ES.058 TaxID=1881061 RepID=UPI00087C485D|nr:transcriptional regulator GcvA [Stappia sp. ES.058]SDU05262.1 transcriptional regulator, LysR family [Stappia sp. ES.058]